jgi:imidazolonepropionase
MPNGIFSSILGQIKNFKHMKKLTGPFKQIISMDHLPINGPIKDSDMSIVENGAVIIKDGEIIAIDDFEILNKNHRIPVEEISDEAILLPGIVDAHTHICFAGSRSLDYSKKIEGITYQKILEEGGGIYNTVNKTRSASFEALKFQTSKRIERHFFSGITTIEIKSGYGLSLTDEIKMLEVIASLNATSIPDLVPTCLAAHVKPKEFVHNSDYLNFILSDILPVIKRKNLTNRVDIFIEKNAFKPNESKIFLKEARKSGFSLTIHADQFSIGGSLVAASSGAVSADHLEVSGSRSVAWRKYRIGHAICTSQTNIR